MKKEIAYLHLKEHQLFSELSRENIYDLLEEIIIRRKRKSDLIDFKAEQNNLIGFILKGKMKTLQLDESGKEFTKDVIREDEFFGNLVDVMDPSIIKYGVVLSDELVYFTINASRLEVLSKEIPQLAINLSKGLNQRLVKMEDRYDSLVNDDVRTRLVEFFKEWAEQDGRADGNQVTIKNYLTHNDIANLISTCRQTVTSILNKLRKEGSIIYSRSEVVIPDLDLLRS